MPVLVVDDDRALAVDNSHIFLDKRVGFLGDLLVEFLAVAVVLVNVLSLFESLVKVAAYEQVHRLHAALHSAGGVDARTDLENHLADRDILVGELAEADDAPQPEIGIGVEAAQSVVCHNAVLPDDGDYVGGYRHCHQVQQRLKFVVVSQTVAQCKGLHEFEPYSAAAQIRARIGRAGHLRIQNRYSVRKCLVGNMMVAHDEVDTLLFSVVDFLYGLYAAVEHDNQFHIVLGRVVAAFERNAIALVITRRDIILHVGIIVLEIFVDECHGGGTVHVIVSVDHDSFLRPHGAVQTVHSLVHVRHKERIMQVGN